jgi:hypothetical protein
MCCLLCQLRNEQLVHQAGRGQAAVAPGVGVWVHCTWQNNKREPVVGFVCLFAGRQRVLLSDYNLSGQQHLLSCCCFLWQEACMLKRVVAACISHSQVIDESSSMYVNTSLM